MTPPSRRMKAQQARRGAQVRVLARYANVMASSAAETQKKAAP
jgi:hypothetical protein